MTAKIRAVVGDHFATAQHIHRQANAHAMPGHPAATSFMAKLHGWAQEI